eukprot:scaffold1356_cov123-Cylindrotheca_fusiformis.AAC.12
MHAIAMKQLRSQVGKNLMRRTLRCWSVHPIMQGSVQATEPIRKFTATIPRNSGFIDYDGVPSSTCNVINDHANQPQTSVSLQALMRTGRGEFLHKSFDEEKLDNDQHTATELVLIQVASFLRRELPIRLAHRVRDLEGVPLMKDMGSVKQVKELYIKSLLELAEFDKNIETAEQEERFSRLVESIYERHSSVLVQMARGAYEFRNHVAKEKGNERDTFAKMEETHAFLDRFYLCRIGIRVLIGQYLALRQPPVDNYVGIICSVTSPYEIVKRAIDDAAFMCTRKYGDAPEVIMSGRLDLTFPYVPTHLHYIMLELLKNSMRATVEWHGVDGDFPPIKVIIADGNDNEDVVIKVSDEGGGIPRSNMKKIWSYLFTTADPSIQEGMVGVNSNAAVDHGIDSPLAGLGYGLPISRSYCRYFGGDLSIMSMEGFGTDCFVYLARLVAGAEKYSAIIGFQLKWKVVRESRFPSKAWICWLPMSSIQKRLALIEQ